MKRAILLLALVGALVTAANAISATTTTVSITATGLVPKSVTVTVGDTVKWVNNDTKSQQVACATCSFTSPVLAPAASYSYSFNTVGKFTITDPLHNNIKGTVTVTAASPVSLTANPGTVKYLATTTLSGADSAAGANANVTILGKACGATTFTKVATAKTAGTGGTFSATDKPTMNTAYEAKIGAATSNVVTVKVQPTIQLTKLGHHKFSVAVTAATSFAGKQVLFQKRRSNGQFVTLKKVTLKTATTSGKTITTSSTFRSRIRHGHRVRISMTLSQTSPCYAASHSPVIRS